MACYFGLLGVPGKGEGFSITAKNPDVQLQKYKTGENRSCTTLDNRLSSGPCRDCKAFSEVSLGMVAGLTKSTDHPADLGSTCAGVVHTLPTRKSPANQPKRVPPWD